LGPSAGKDMTFTVRSCYNEGAGICDEQRLSASSPSNLFSTPAPVINPVSLRFFSTYLEPTDRLVLRNFDDTKIAFEGLHFVPDRYAYCI